MGHGPSSSPKGELLLDPRYNRVYAPVLRSPLLFHQNTLPSKPNYYQVQPTAVPSSVNYYRPYSSPSTLQSQYAVQTAALPSYSQSYPYYSSPPLGSTYPQAMPFSSYAGPAVTYPTTASSKGLALILIATLILVALDLAIVRPQKRQNSGLALIEP